MEGIIKATAFLLLLLNSNVIFYKNDTNGADFIGKAQDRLSKQCLVDIDSEAGKAIASKMLVGDHNLNFVEVVDKPREPSKSIIELFEKRSDRDFIVFRPIIGQSCAKRHEFKLQPEAPMSKYIHYICYSNDSTYEVEIDGVSFEFSDRYFNLITECNTLLNKSVAEEPNFKRLRNIYYHYIDNKCQLIESIRDDVDRMCPQRRLCNDCVSGNNATAEKKADVQGEVILDLINWFLAFALLSLAWLGGVEDIAACLALVQVLCPVFGTVVVMLGLTEEVGVTYAILALFHLAITLSGIVQLRRVSYFGMMPEITCWEFCVFICYYVIWLINPVRDEWNLQYSHRLGKKSHKTITKSNILPFIVHIILGLRGFCNRKKLWWPVHIALICISIYTTSASAEFYLTLWRGTLQNTRPARQFHATKLLMFEFHYFVVPAVKKAVAHLPEGSWIRVCFSGTTTPEDNSRSSSPSGDDRRQNHPTDQMQLDVLS